MARRKINTPVEFLNMAKERGIPEEIANEYYVIKTLKKSTANLESRVANRTRESFESVRRKFKELWESWRNHSWEPRPSKSKENGPLDEAYRELKKIIGTPKKIKEKKKSNKSTKKIVVASDFHIPFVNRDALSRLMEESGDILWIPGDFLDMYSVSKYRKHLDFITVRDELARGRAVLEELAKRFGEVKILSGNHEDRVNKRVQEVLPQIMPLIVSPLEVLSSGIKNVTVEGIKIPETGFEDLGTEDITLNNLGFEGDILLSHMDFVGKRALDKLMLWLYSWSETLNVEVPRVFIHGHTHRLGVNFLPKVVLISSGCLCAPQEYMVNGNVSIEPPCNGFVVLEQNNGITNLESIKVIKT